MADGYRRGIERKLELEIVESSPERFFSYGRLIDQSLREGHLESALEYLQKAEDLRDSDSISLNDYEGALDRICSYAKKQGAQAQVKSLAKSQTKKRLAANGVTHTYRPSRALKKAGDCDVGFYVPGTDISNCRDTCLTISKSLEFMAAIYHLFRTKKEANLTYVTSFAGSVVLFSKYDDNVDTKVALQQRYPRVVIEEHSDDPRKQVSIIPHHFDNEIDGLIISYHAFPTLKRDLLYLFDKGKFLLENECLDAELGEDLFFNGIEKLIIDSDKTCPTIVKDILNTAELDWGEEQNFSKFEVIELETFNNPCVDDFEIIDVSNQLFFWGKGMGNYERSKYLLIVPEWGMDGLRSSRMILIHQDEVAGYILDKDMPEGTTVNQQEDYLKDPLQFLKVMSYVVTTKKDSDHYEIEINSQEELTDIWQKGWKEDYFIRGFSTCFLIPKESAEEQIKKAINFFL